MFLVTVNRFIDLGYVVVRDGGNEGLGIGRESASDLPIISKAGFTILPGQIDSHAHGLGENTVCTEQPIRFGVTTVCDMHNEPKHIKSLKALSASDRRPYSDFKCAGTEATVPGGWPVLVEGDVRHHLANTQAFCLPARGVRREGIFAGVYFQEL